MNNETQLVSFGNYLFDRYGVMEHSTDGKNTPLYPRGVHDADLRNWEDENPILSDSSTLPSRFQVKDRVSIQFQKLGLFIKEAIVTKVHFTESKVLYDLNIQLVNDNNGIGSSTRIYNVDSLIVSPFNESTHFRVNTSDGALVSQVINCNQLKSTI